MTDLLIYAGVHAFLVAVEEVMVVVSRIIRSVASVVMTSSEFSEDENKNHDHVCIARMGCNLESG